MRALLAELMPLLRADGVRAASTSSVLGDPTTATAVEGAALLAELAPRSSDRSGHGSRWW